MADILGRSHPDSRVSHGSVEQPGVFAGLSSRRSRVQIPSFPPTPSLAKMGLLGQVAQLAERRSEKPEVDGSTPSLTTITPYSCRAPRSLPRRQPPMMLGQVDPQSRGH